MTRGKSVRVSAAERVFAKRRLHRTSPGQGVLSDFDFGASILLNDKLLTYRTVRLGGYSFTCGHQIVADKISSWHRIECPSENLVLGVQLRAYLIQLASAY